MSRIGGSGGPKIWNNSEQPQQQGERAAQPLPTYTAAPANDLDLLTTAISEALRTRSLEAGEVGGLVSAPKQKLVSSDEMQIDTEGDAAWVHKDEEHAPNQDIPSDPSSSDNDDGPDIRWSPLVSDSEDEAPV